MHGQSSSQAVLEVLVVGHHHDTAFELADRLHEASVVSRSRWLVGSSRISRCGKRYIAAARHTRHLVRFIRSNLRKEMTVFELCVSDAFFVERHLPTAAAAATTTTNTNTTHFCPPERVRIFWCGRSSPPNPKRARCWRSFCACASPPFPG